MCRRIKLACLSVIFLRLDGNFPPLESHHDKDGKRKLLDLAQISILFPMSDRLACLLRLMFSSALTKEFSSHSNAQLYSLWVTRSQGAGSCIVGLIESMMWSMSRWLL